jgi:hypothetical protein
MRTRNSIVGLFGLFCLIGGAGAFAQEAPGGRVETCSITYDSPEAAKAALANLKDKIVDSAHYTLIDSWTGAPNMGWTTDYARFSNGAGKVAYSCELYALDCSSSDSAVAAAKASSAQLTALGFVVIDATFDQSGTCGITYLAPAPAAAAAGPSAARLTPRDAAGLLNAAQRVETASRSALP